MGRRQPAPKWRLAPQAVSFRWQQLTGLRRSADLSEAEIHYVLSSREGFTTVLQRRARDGDVLLVTVADIFN